MCVYYCCTAAAVLLCMPTDSFLLLAAAVVFLTYHVVSYHTYGQVGVRTYKFYSCSAAAVRTNASR